MLYALLVSTILITLAELGDKTQLLALALAARYRVWQVLVGITVATVAVHLFSTLAGRLIGGLIPPDVLGVVTGLLFVGFGVWTLRGDKDGDDDSASRGRFGPVATVAIAFFLAELGDKTQIMTMTIAADPAAVLRTFGSVGPAVGDWLASLGFSARGLGFTETFWGVWVGSTLGMLIADGIAIVVGAMLGKRLPERAITRVSGVVFILFGVMSIAAVFLR